MEELLFNFVATIVLEFLVLLLFFRKDWLGCLQFSILVNAVTLPIGTFIYLNTDINWFLLEGIIFAVEAVTIYWYWQGTRIPKAILASTAANTLTAGLFPVLYWLGIEAYPF